MVATLDGNDMRTIRIVPGWVGSPAGTWSPDGTSILSGDGEATATRIVMVDAVTGEAVTIADGRTAIWVDDERFLVDV